MVWGVAKITDKKLVWVVILPTYSARLPIEGFL